VSADCLFCKIIRGEVPSTKVTETDHLYAFQDIAPQAPTHILVVHKTHTHSLSETADNQIFAELFGGIRELVGQLNLSHYRVVINNGAEAGQSVFHLHAHILSGRPLAWPPG
jgi:histidine triad (HIT) family protein